MNTLYYIELYNEGGDEIVHTMISATSAQIAEMQAVNGMCGEPEQWEVVHVQRVCLTPDDVDLEL